MKFKVTKKEMRNGYDKIVGVGYCNLQNLLNYEKEIAYSTRSEGWACDYYDVKGVLISTGYAPLNSKNVKCDYDIMKKYDDQAMEVRHMNISYEERKEKVTALLHSFIEEITAQEGKGMKINPVKSSSYKEVLPQYIVDYIQKYAQDINDTVNPKTENNSIIKNKLKNCDKTQLKQ